MAEVAAAVADVAAPAQPVVSTIPATDAAVASRDSGKYREARRHERTGTPLPDVSVTPPAAAPDAAIEPVAAAPAQPAVSKRQEKINDYERRIAEQDQRIRALEAGQAPPAAVAQPKVDAAPSVPEYKRYAAMPDAPKIDAFEGDLTEYSAAMALFIADKRHDERIAGDQQQRSGEQRTRFLTERSEKFGTSLRAARDADPDFANQIPPALISAKPLSALGPNERATFANAAAEAAFLSDDPPTFLRYLHAHQDETLRLAGLPPSQWLTALTRLDGRLTAPAPAAIVAPPKPQPKTLSDAPDTPTLGSRPSEATDPEADAIRRKDSGAYRRIKRQRLAAGMGR